MGNIPKLICKQCKTVYKPWHSPKVAKSSFCSRSCRNKFHGSGRPRKKTSFTVCKNCFNKFEYWPSLRPNAEFCCSKCRYEYKRKSSKGQFTRDGYKMVLKNEKGTGYVLEHRKIFADLGINIDSKHIHHINGIKTDNRIENLKIINPSEHAILHNTRHPEQISG